MTVTKVIFYQIKLDHTKLIKIIQTAHLHFKKKEPLLIIAPDDKSALFVDDLLWKNPVNSFLPHVISNNFCNDLIVLTTKKNNINNARHIFNLCPTPIIMEEITVVYDFEDITNHLKAEVSKNKYNHYRKMGCRIESH